MAKIDISLILACYNEGPTLTSSLKKICEVLDNTHYKYEIICIDDKSKDETFKTLNKFSRIRRNVKAFLHKENVGRGGTVAEGIKRAHGEVVGFIDVDLEVSPLYVPEFVRTIKNKADVTIATRIYKIEPTLSSLLRGLSSKIYVTLVRKLLRLNFKDTEAGYKFFKRRKILPVLNKTKDKKWFFDTEIVARSFWAQLKIKEIPVLFLRRTDKKSTVNLFSDTIAYLKAIWEFRNQNLREIHKRRKIG